MRLIFFNSLNLLKIENKMPNKQYFHKIWFSDNGFMEWIVWSVSKENSQDKLCHTSLSNMGEKVLHSYGNKHKKMFTGVLLYCVFLNKDIWWYFWFMFLLQGF